MTATNQRPSSPIDPNEPVRVNHTLRNSIIAVIVVAVLAVGGFLGYRAVVGTSETAPKGSADNPVRIGVVGATDPQWQVFQRKAEAEGIHVDIIDFQDYTSENPALDTGDLDLNEFQHLLYLANYNVGNGKDLQPIGGTAIYPLGVYSTKYRSIDEIPDGATVVIPNDETNQARAIGVLESAGLITLTGEWTAFTTPADIDESESKVNVTALKAEQVANSLSDPQVAAGIVNNVYVSDAGIDPDDAIYQDDAESESARPYINVWVARKDDADNETYLKLAQLFRDPEVFEALRENSGGTAVDATGFSAEELQGFLADIEDDVRAAQ
ncbi:ABC transporter substrate-binding protein [Bifidobacterium lemurum]|uniref:ABC transporter substrate-binding protein n=1 Tax=Bifidobacterium lemurum TaxID=1603886 RepID=A0A261FVT5_9BIFI|nr:MetQ/NlpA family ABC transporter substrate-binding protein [Bifidobacterium lemurum]OZG63304.1 ABC transporter substrate-binding protein [Bifidobacterium lemurum]QOL34224.1 ABC transporter substrate-binding protein [Bifidobacterium lemurum]